MSVGRPIPRLTYWPSRSSCATRAASCVRVIGNLLSSVPFARRHALDAFSARPDLHDALHEDPREMHLLGIDAARLDEIFDLGDRDAAGHPAERVEVARRLVEDQVAVAVAEARAHEGEVGDDA